MSGGGWIALRRAIAALLSLPRRRVEGGAPPSIPPPPPAFALRRRGADAVEAVVCGRPADVTQTLFDAVRELGGSPGIIFVEYREAPREWIAAAVSAPAALEGLLAIRDLLGTAALDVAVFSTPRNIEIILDRHGTLEIRAGAWHEPRLRSLLARGPYVEDPGLTTLPRAAAGEFAWTLEVDARFRAVMERLGAAEPGSAPAEGSG